MKTARVSYTDLHGIEHAVNVGARSLYHAVGIAIRKIQAVLPLESEADRAALKACDRAADREERWYGGS